MTATSIRSRWTLNHAFRQDVRRSVVRCMARTRSARKHVAPRSPRFSSPGKYSRRYLEIRNCIASFAVAV
jgi:hypothetical protein